MKRTRKMVTVLTLVFACSVNIAAKANNAVEELFTLLDKGGCDSSSMIGKTWTISTFPSNMHGELTLGDTLEFELTGVTTGITRMGTIQVTRNSVVWPSANGWIGQCTTNGSISQFIISGDVDVDGCIHDVAFGRLDHDDSLSDKIEVAFQDSGVIETGGCTEASYLHPGHAHGTKE